MVQLGNGPVGKICDDLFEGYGFEMAIWNTNYMTLSLDSITFIEHKHPNSYLGDIYPKALIEIIDDNVVLYVHDHIQLFEDIGNYTNWKYPRSNRTSDEGIFSLERGFYDE